MESVHDDVYSCSVLSKNHDCKISCSLMFNLLVVCNSVFKFLGKGAKGIALNVNAKNTSSNVKRRHKYFKGVHLLCINFVTVLTSETNNRSTTEIRSTVFHL